MLAALIYGIWNYSQPVLLAMAIAYVGSGVVVRLGGIVKRITRRGQPAGPEHPADTLA